MFSNKNFSATDKINVSFLLGIFIKQFNEKQTHIVIIVIFEVNLFGEGLL